MTRQEKDDLLACMDRITTELNLFAKLIEKIDG